MRSQEMTRGHSEALMPMIEDLVSGDYGTLTRIAVCTGPGSFTGLRLGISAARGLALGLNIPCIGVSRFEAVAAGRSPQTSDFSVALKGRGDRIFVQSFRNGMPENRPYQTTALPDGPAFGDGVPGASEKDGLVDPVALGRLAATRRAGERPAPLYLREADAAPSRDQPPEMLD